MKTTRFRTPLTAAALVLVLAACGGGGGGAQRGVGSSPQPPANQGQGQGVPPGGHGGQSGQNDNGGQNGGQGNGGTGDSGGNGSGSGGTDGGGSSDGNDPGTITPIVSNLPLISAKGVRGDVLLAMLDQKSCAQLARATNYNGTPLTGTKTPNVTADVGLSPTNYVRAPGHTGRDPSNSQLNAQCSDTYYQYRAAGEGRAYTITEHSYPRYYHAESVGASQRVHFHEVKVPLTVNTTGFTLGSSISVRNGPDDGVTNFWSPTANVESLTLSAGAARSVAFNSLINYGVLIEWKSTDRTSTGRTEQLLLVRGQGSTQAKLCWNAGLQYAHRLHCTVWKAPKGWKRGQKLTFDGHYLVDDRTSYPGEKGFFYWR